MAKQTKIIIFPYLHPYLEDEYFEETGISPYVDGKNKMLTFEYIKAVTDNNVDVIGEIDEDALREWYENEIVIPNKLYAAPGIHDMIQRVINVYFIKEYKLFFNKNNKKNPADYVLNVDKLIEEKMQGTPPVVFNSVQTFMLNYEIKKLFDKAITITNCKYDNIVYINNKLEQNGILNVIGHLEKTHSNYSFKYVLLDKENEFADIVEKCNTIMLVTSLF